MIATYIQGFGIGAGLIIVIGAQNAFVLSQGIKKEYHWLVPLICSLCDCILIIVGAAGMGVLIAEHPSLTRITGWVGAVFLAGYGTRAYVSAFSSRFLAENTEKRTRSLRNVVLTTLALTLLNPHVYLDTIVLLGSVSSRYMGTHKALFALGACSASIVWFFFLSFAGTLARPVFRNPVFWKILDLLLGTVMWFIAFAIWPE